MNGFTMSIKSMDFELDFYDTAVLEKILDGINKIVSKVLE